MVSDNDKKRTVYNPKNLLGRPGRVKRLSILDEDREGRGVTGGVGDGGHQVEEL